MAKIDADAHVLETPETWKYLEPAEQRFLPTIVTQTFGNEVRNSQGILQKDYWLIDGDAHEMDFNTGADTPKEAREVADIGARLAHMDELGIDIQVLYPTLFLRPVARGLESEYALCRSYNRWLAETWRQGGGRLRWVAMPPLLSMDRVRDEMLFARDNGACGIFLRGLECELPISDPYFFPLYEMAVELDLPICVHSASGSFIHHDFYQRDNVFPMFKLATVAAFHSLLFKEIPAKFPGLRWGFVEIGASFVPYVLTDLADRFRRQGKTLTKEPLKDFGIYVACEVKEDLAYILTYTGEDNLIVGTDYGHNDATTEINAIRLIEQDDRLDPPVRRKILDDNARALYGLD